ncbi:hypothetical protein V5799_027300 [Amblyomma americanum]|uniref:Uncharacterized protein n=1 Tax=Amblyomma americanum TaxID=6943 RepID=A0AAQ4DG44_AMBAM
MAVKSPTGSGRKYGRATGGSTFVQISTEEGAYRDGPSTAAPIATYGAGAHYGDFRRNEETQLKDANTGTMREASTVSDASVPSAGISVQGVGSGVPVSSGAGAPGLTATRSAAPTTVTATAEQGVAGFSTAAITAGPVGGHAPAVVSTGAPSSAFDDTAGVTAMIGAATFRLAGASPASGGTKKAADGNPSDQISAAEGTQALRAVTKDSGALVGSAAGSRAQDFTSYHASSLAGSIGPAATGTAVDTTVAAATPGTPAGRSAGTFPSPAIGGHAPKLVPEATHTSTERPAAGTTASDGAAPATAPTAPALGGAEISVGAIGKSNNRFNVISRLHITTTSATCYKRFRFSSIQSCPPNSNCKWRRRTLASQINSSRCWRISSSSISRSSFIRIKCSISRQWVLIST